MSDNKFLSNAIPWPSDFEHEDLRRICPLSVSVRYLVDGLFYFHICEIYMIRNDGIYITKRNDYPGDPANFINQPGYIALIHQ